MKQVEEHLAHLQRIVDEMSDVIAKQDAELRVLKSQVKELVQREAQREADASGGATFSDERPPHY